MRRIRHLKACDYIVNLAPKPRQILSFCGQDNITLERTWQHIESYRPIPILHAKFNGHLMNGVQIKANLTVSGRPLQSIVSSMHIYRVSDVDWTESLIGSISTSDLGGIHSGYVPQSTLGANELSGRETYAVDCILRRRRQIFRAKAWFNHIGCYDSLMILRRDVEYLHLAKVDE